MFNKICIFIFLIIVCSVSASQADKWESLNAGGQHSHSDNYQLDGSIGQSVAGMVDDDLVQGQIGFWVSMDEYFSLAEAKTLPDGTWLSLSDKLTSSGCHDFSDCFYVEEPDRTSGLKISASSDLMQDVTRNSIVSVTGTIQTNSDGERQLVSDGVTIEKVGVETKYR